MKYFGIDKGEAVCMKFKLVKITLILALEPQFCIESCILYCGLNEPRNKNYALTNIDSHTRVCVL